MDGEIDISDVVQ